VLSGLPVANLVDAGAVDGVEGLSGVELAAPHGVAARANNRHRCGRGAPALFVPPKPVPSVR